MSSVDINEIEHFARDSAHWWDESGPFAPLHHMNPVRMRYIRGQIETHFDLDPKSLKPFENIKILDVGCGGGLICEPLARLKARVTGIDADETAIAVAKEHAQQSGLNIDYQCTTSDSLAKRNDFDVVLALEIIEHVTDINLFVKSCIDLCKPGGLLIFSTLNRTPKSFALGIVAAEYILRWVPRGTHHWKKFVKPSELSRILRCHDAETKDISGLIYNPLNHGFSLSNNDLEVNYFLGAQKN